MSTFTHRWLDCRRVAARGLVKSRCQNVFVMNIQARVENAWLEIIAARITHLAYAPEIAAVMLQRQQASAIGWC